MHSRAVVMLLNDSWLLIAYLFTKILIHAMTRGAYHTGSDLSYRENMYDIHR